MKTAIRITVVLLVIIAIITLINTAAAQGAGWTQRQMQANQIANLARAMGLPEDDPIIQRAKALWHEDEGRERDIAILARTIYREAGNGCKEEHMLLVGRVVLNREADERFPDTVYDVVVQKGQYHPGYANGGSNFDVPADRLAEFEDYARRALAGEPYDCPDDIVWQAEFRQGTGVYKSFYSELLGTTTYFCYG